jgi:hypothetical protein
MASDVLSGFKGAVVFEKIGDAGRPEGVRRIVRGQPRLFEPSFKHVRGRIGSVASAAIPHNGVIWNSSWDGDRIDRLYEAICRREGIDAVGNASKPQVARAKANNLEDILTRSE